MARYIALLFATLCSGACGPTADSQQCFYAIKNIHSFSDDNFNAIGDKLWADDAPNSVAFHHSGYHLFIEARCGVGSMEELTNFFGVPFATGNQYEVYEITEPEYKKYRAGLLEYP